MGSNFRTWTVLLSAPIRRDFGAQIFSQTSTTCCFHRFLVKPTSRPFSTDTSYKPRPSSAKDTAPNPIGKATHRGIRSHKAETSNAVTLSSDDDGDTKPLSRLSGADYRAAGSSSAFPTDEKVSKTRKKTKRLELLSDTKSRPQAPREHWQTQKDALKEKFGEQGWQPRKKLSPDTIEGIRALHEQYPDKYTTHALAQDFKVSPEAIRRILKSKWRPAPEKMVERRERWARRHDRIWDAQSELGLRPKRTKDKRPEVAGTHESIIPLAADVGA